MAPLLRTVWTRPPEDTDLPESPADTDLPEASAETDLPAAPAEGVIDDKSGS